MNKRAFGAVMLVASVFSLARADVISDVRAGIAQVIEELPVRRRHVGVLWNYDIVFATNSSYCALAAMVSNNWRVVLENLDRCATNQYERLLLLGTRDRFGADYYMDFMDALVDIRTNGQITAEEFSWTESTEVAGLERLLERDYCLPRVRALVGRFKIAEPNNSYWDEVLSGVAYSNYLGEVEAGVWGKDPR